MQPQISAQTAQSHVHLQNLAVTDLMDCIDVCQCTVCGLTVLLKLPEKM